jgi:hypothetical protein
VLAVVCRGSAVAAGISAVVRRRPAIVRGRLAARACHFGLVHARCVPDRGSHVAFTGLAIARCGRVVALVGRAIGVIALVGRLHAVNSNRGGGDAEMTGA